MMLNSQTAHRLRSRSAVLSGVALAAVSMMMLTGCSGSGIGGGELDGTYWYVSNDRVESQIVVKGNDVTVYEPTCVDSTGKGVSTAILDTDNPNGFGKISDDQTQVMWTTEEAFIGDVSSSSGTVPLVVSSAGDLKAFTVDGFEYRTTDNSDDEMLETFAAWCSS